jgi:hypothetical protein
MKWSKLKKLAENLLADSVKDHLQFHVTTYGPGVSYIMTRAWVTWDKSEIISMSTIEWLMKLQMFEPNSFGSAAIHAVLKEQGIYSRYDFYEALEEYVNLPVEDALHSTNDIIKAVSMFDRRLGKRRLLKLSRADIEHPLVKQFFNLRCQSENLI